MSRIPFFLIACALSFAPLSASAQTTTETEAPVADEAPAEEVAPEADTSTEPETDAEAPIPLNAEDGRVAGFTIVTPLRTLLTQGVTLQIDNGSQQKYQFGWCTEAGCAARFAVRADGLSQFKRGNKSRLTVHSVEKPDAPVILDVSLKGFTAAFDDLTAR